MVKLLYNNRRSRLPVLGEKLILPGFWLGHPPNVWFLLVSRACRYQLSIGMKVSKRFSRQEWGRVDLPTQ